MNLWHAHSGASHLIIRADRLEEARDLAAKLELERFSNRPTRFDDEPEEEDLEYFKDGWIVEKLVIDGDFGVVHSWWGVP